MDEHPEAKRVHEGLKAAANEFRLKAAASDHKATKECAEIDRQACELGADLIAALDTEVF